MKRLMIFLIAILVLQVTGCSTMKVAVHHDPTVDFSQYKTYKFVQPKDGGQRMGGEHRFISQEVLFQIKPIMEEKGFTEVKDTKDADLLVHFYTFVKNKRYASPPTYHVGRWGRTWVARPGHVVRYKEGTLGIDIVDRKSKTLVWQGMGKDVLDPNQTAEHFAEAVAKVLKDFPPLK